VLIREDRRVDDDGQRRAAANEARLRDVNKAIERGHYPAEEGERVGFRYECARLGCDRVIELTIGEYEQVRAHPRRFLLIQAHEVPGEDTLVDPDPAGWWSRSATSRARSRRPPTREGE
jgi:hypothetical protein